MDDFRCANYANIPPQCRMVPDVMNPCCRKPYCDFSGVHGQHTGQGHLTPSPGPGGHPTPSPKPSKSPWRLTYFLFSLFNRDN